ncbi:hypothetical protein B0H11DRAFT_1845516 [Mycena galericulata]|nr:hypothetical protein B0H11DRAFT_1845516 [Mycena galericulata]
MKDITSQKSGPGWENWPPPGDLQKLCNKADGLFHYAATALHWIEAQMDEHGRACQGWVLKNLTREGGLDQLEDLYRVILTSFEDIDKPARNAERRMVRLASFQHVIGTILVLRTPLTISQIMGLLANIPVGDFDVGHFLRQMHSVLIPGTTTSFEEATPQMHKSFCDYIMDGHAPAEFRILMGHAHLAAARSCMEVIVEAGSKLDAAVKYSVQHWYHHLRKAVEGLGTMTWEAGSMGNLFEQMAEEAVFDVWKAGSWWVFRDMAAVGWGLLKQGTNKHRMEGISSILMKVKVRSGSSPLCPNPQSDLFFSSIVTQIVRPHIPLISTNIFWLQPYQSIWDQGLLKTWESNQHLETSFL